MKIHELTEEKMEIFESSDDDREDLDYVGDVERVVEVDTTEKHQPSTEGTGELTNQDAICKVLHWIIEPWPTPPKYEDTCPEKGPTMTTRQPTDPNLDLNSDLLTRTSWVDAKTAYREIKKGRAFGNTCALRLRGTLQKHLFNLGCCIQKHCGKVLFVGLLLLSLCCVGLKTATIETDVNKLWIEAGGRLEKELAYTKEKLGEGSGYTSQLIVQTPKLGTNVLSAESFKLHLKAVEAATKVTVDMYDIKWKFKDLCFPMTFPSFDNYLLDSILDNVLPCVILTPLDCFWEGSKLLGPDNPIAIPGMDRITWANLNPTQLVQELKDLEIPFPSDTIEEMLQRAGITSAYQEKPCLDPTDEQCPKTAPNYFDKQIPNVGEEVTGGCSGFAAKYMHWEEDLIIGGAQKNKNGYIFRAGALQSILQLMGEKSMYEHYLDDYKVNNIEWSQETAKKVLEKWQREYTTVVNKILNETSQDSVYSFSSTSLTDILDQFSEVSIVRVALGYCLMLVYAAISLLRWNDAIYSQSGIGIAGVLLVALSVAAGLGLCSVFQIGFNASTTQIIPFLALGLGVDDMFLIALTFAENSRKDDIPYMDQTGECLKRTGVSVLITSLSNACAFFMAAIIPIPALRAFALQAAILILFNLGSILLIYPAIISLDLMRRQEKRVDVFCCFEGSSANRVIELQSRPQSPPPEYRETSPPPSYRDIHRHNTMTTLGPDGVHPVTVLVGDNDGARFHSAVSPSSLPPSATSSRQCLTPDEDQSCKDRCVQTQQECCKLSLTWFAKKVYGPLLQKASVKILVIILFSVLLAFGVWGTTKVKDGLELTDIVPRETTEYKFLETQSKYFGFYNIYAVTKDFDYPNNQELLHKYHNAFLRIENIIKKEDGSLPDSWLILMRNWLLDLQRSFDRDYQLGCITRDQWYDNATEEGIFAYKLLIQTGDSDSPINKDLALTSRLVDADGIINKEAFYIYLTAWTSNDAIAYAASMSDLTPVPREWLHLPEEVEFLIPRSQPLTYAQFPFYLNNMADTDEITSTIKQIRTICDTYVAKGLPNYPSGIPFTFWEQYLNLRFYLMLSLICVLGAVFMVITFILMNPWAAFMVVMVLAMTVVELFGFMGLVSIKLSAVPAVILIVSVGIGVEFTVHILLAFITCIGTRNARMNVALRHMLAPVMHGAVSTLLGVIMLVGSEFDFIVRYFFYVLSALILIGVLNGLVLLPVLLSIIGPPAEIIPRDNADRIQPPTPEPSPVPQRAMRTVSKRVFPGRVPSDISLTTITEEPTQYSSHEIVVHPEVVVETSFVDTGTNTHNNTNRHSASHNTRNSTPPSSVHNISGTRHSSSHNNNSHNSHPQTTPHFTTTVKAKATVKVEVHTPLPGAVDSDHGYKHKRRRHKRSPQQQMLEFPHSTSESSDTSNKS